MVKKFKNLNKKGGVELSLNLIIMLIIGMTVLALVIGFVTNLISKGTSNLDTELDKAEAQEMQVVLESPGIFAVGPTPFKLSSNGNRKIFIKIYNPTDTALYVGELSGDIYSGSSNVISDALGGTVSISATSIDLDASCAISVKSAPVTINAKDTQVITASIIASNGCTPGKSLFLSVVFAPDADTTKTETLSGEITSN